MIEAVVGHPAEPADKGNSTYGGFADIARRLNALHPERPKPISRQLVERWWKCRESNGMPDRELVEVEGRVKALFDLRAVELWHRTQHRARKVNPPIETIPLFQIDHRGHPVDERRGHPVDAEASSYRGHPQVRETYRSSILDL